MEKRPNRTGRKATTPRIALQVSQEEHDILNKAAQIDKRKVANFCRWAALEKAEELLREQEARCPGGQNGGQQ